MRVLHITSWIGKASFGVGPVVLNLAKYQSDKCDVNVWATDSEEETWELQKEYALKENSVRSFPVFGPGRLSYSLKMTRSIGREADTFDVIHQHGIWTAVSLTTNAGRKQAALPTIVAPHGSLAPWCLTRSQFKKQLALRLYESHNLQNSACLHALSMEEAKEIRAFGLNNPIAIIPNGISDDWLLQPATPDRFRQQENIPAEKRIMLYLGRITPKKGIPLFLRALNLVKQDLDHWQVLLAGVDEFGHLAEVQELIKQLGLGAIVKYVGPQYGKYKRSAFAAAELFVLPSYSEGAPVVILEALGAGVPVLATKGSPWEELETHGCGWWADISEEALAKGIGEAVQKPKEELKLMGQKGKSLVSQKYAWSHIAEQTIGLYKWLMNGGTAPEFVLEN